MRYLLIFVTALTVWGCATAPLKFDFNPVATIPGDFDVVWSAIIEYFAISNVPITTIEKDSGIIVSDWMDASAQRSRAEDETFCSCGRAGVATIWWTRVRFSVFAKRTDAASVDVRVTCLYQQHRQFADLYATGNCNSTGYLERQLHEYVMAKVQGSPAPEVQVLQRATSD